MVRNLPNRLVPCPSVQFLGATIPERDNIVVVAHEDCVVCEVEKVCPFAQNLFAPFAFRDLGLQLFSSSPKVGGPLIDSCFQFIARLLKRLFRPAALNTYPAGDER